jgi:hypothetical protein
MNKILLRGMGLVYFLAAAALAWAQSNSEDSFSSAVEAFGKLSNGQKDMVLSSTGLPSPAAGGFSIANLIASLIFGSIGFIAFFYGKKNASWKPLVIGIILMAYPYVVSSTTMVYVIGVGLTASLYFFRD